MNFFNKFQDMELNEEVLNVAPPLKETVVITFEQLLFYHTNPEDAARYRRASSWERRRRHRYLDLKKQRKAILMYNPEYRTLQKERDELSMQSWRVSNEEAKPMNERIDEIVTIQKQILADTYAVGSLTGAMEQQKAVEEIAKGVMKNTEFTVTAESPIENFISLGALDYTRDPNFDTWDDNRLGGLHDHLADLCLESIDNPEKIIIFAGLHARQHPFRIAERIAEEAKLRRGIVSVYTTGSCKPYPGYSQDWGTIDRYALCDQLMPLMPETVGKLEMVCGRKVGSIMEMIT